MIDTKLKQIVDNIKNLDAMDKEYTSDELITKYINDTSYLYGIIALLIIKDSTSIIKSVVVNNGRVNEEDVLASVRHAQLWGYLNESKSGEMPLEEDVNKGMEEFNEIWTMVMNKLELYSDNLGETNMLTNALEKTNTNLN